jgi:hypothetical protein
MISIEELIQIAQDIEHTDPIDWGYLNISEENAYRLIATGLLEHFDSITDMDTKYIILLAIATKLSVENFVLNLKLLNR